MYTDSVFDQGAMAPSLMVKFSSAMISSGSNSMMVPRPEQEGHAPYGLLNENVRG